MRERGRGKQAPLPKWGSLAQSVEGKKNDQTTLSSIESLSPVRMAAQGTT